VESQTDDKWCVLTALGPEVARHQQIDDCADFAFNSRRLHHSRDSSRDVVSPT
jgi:hypothetical protein